MEYLQSEISALREMKSDLEIQLYAAHKTQNLVSPVGYQFGTILVVIFKLWMGDKVKF